MCICFYIAIAGLLITYLIGLKKNEDKLSINKATLVELCLFLAIVWPAYIIVVPMMLFVMADMKLIEYIKSKIE